MRNRWILNLKHTLALFLCITTIVPLAGCNKSDVEATEKEPESREITSGYDINEAAYDTYIEYDNMFLLAETAYLNDAGYVESSDVPAVLNEVEQLIQQGVSDGTIAYYNKEDDNIFIKFASGIPYLFIPYEKDVLSGGGGGRILTLEPNEDDYNVNFRYLTDIAAAWGCDIECEDSLRPSSNANLVVENAPDLYTYDFPHDSIDPPFGPGDSLKNLNVTVESLKTLADYKLIIWEGHGGYNKEIHSALITGESFTEWKGVNEYKSDLEDDIIILTSFPTVSEADMDYSPARYYGITSKFVEKYIGEMEESLIFLEACSSLKDDILAQSFLDKGASVVLGYTQETSMYYEMISRAVFFTELVKEKDSGYQTVADAYQSTMNIVGDDKGCRLSYISQDGVDEQYTLNGIFEPKAGAESYKNYASVIESIQNRITYNDYSNSLKEYCRGEFFEIDGKKALVLMYYVSDNSDLTPGYYTGLWVENATGTISCLADQLVEEVLKPDDAYVTVNIRTIDGKMYLNPYVRTTNDNTDISKNQYYLIGDELVLECDLYSEAPFVSMGDGLIQHDDSKSLYYLNQEIIDRSAFYSTQDKLNIGTYLLGLDPNWAEGLPPQGYIFEELLDQLQEQGHTPKELLDQLQEDTKSSGASIAELSEIVNAYFSNYSWENDDIISAKVFEGDGSFQNDEDVAFVLRAETKSAEWTHISNVYIADVVINAETLKGYIDWGGEKEYIDFSESASSASD